MEEGEERAKSRVDLVPVQGALNGGTSGTGCRIPHDRIAEELILELFAGLVHGKFLAGSVDLVDLCQHENISCGTGAIRQGNAHEEQTDDDAPTGAKLADGHDDATCARAGKADSLNGGHKRLEGEYEEEHHKVEAGVRLEGLISWTIPAEKRGGGEQDGVEDGQPEGAEFARVDQYDQTAENVNHHDQRVEHPQIVEPLDHLLELDRNIDVDVVVETRLHRAHRRQRGPIVGALVRTAHHVCFPALQFPGFSLQLFLRPLELSGGDLSHSGGFTSANGRCAIAVGLILCSTRIVDRWGLCGRV